MKHHYKKRSRRISRSAAWFLVVAGILLGTVFSFGMRYWESSVSKEDAIHIEAAFSSYEKQYKRYQRGVREIEVYFQNRDPLFIDGTLCSQSVQDGLEKLEPGTILQLYVHPQSNQILEIQTDKEAILVFEEAIDKLSSKVSGFLFLGIFMYVCSGYGIIKLLLKQID